MSTLAEGRDHLRALHAQYEEAVEHENSGAIVEGIEDAAGELVAAVPGLLDDVEAAEREVERLSAALRVERECNLANTAELHRASATITGLASALEHVALRNFADGPCFCVVVAGPHHLSCLNARTALAKAKGGAL